MPCDSHFGGRPHQTAVGRKGLRSGLLARAWPQSPESVWQRGHVGKSLMNGSLLELVSVPVLCPHSLDREVSPALSPSAHHHWSPGCGVRPLVAPTCPGSSLFCAAPQGSGGSRCTVRVGPAPEAWTAEPLVPPGRRSSEGREPGTAAAIFSLGSHC